MLVGHHAVGFAAKPLAPRVSLASLQMACVFPDLLTFALQLVGIEHARVTPGITAFSSLDGYAIAISHSLATNVLWAAVFAGVYFWWRRDLRGAYVLSGVVFSHWVLDFISHRPELPLVPGIDRYVGLGLWDSIPLTFVVEGALWLIGILIYLRATKPTSRAGTFGLYVFIGFLTLAWIRTPFAPQPPGDFSAIALLALLAVYSGLFAIAYWIDVHRTSRVLTLRT